MSENIYTQEQLDIAILKNTNEGVLGTLHRLETKIESNFHWTLSLIIGIYFFGITGLIGAIAHVYGWL